MTQTADELARRIQSWCIAPPGYLRLELPAELCGDGRRATAIEERPAGPARRQPVPR